MSNTACIIMLSCQGFPLCSVQFFNALNSTRVRRTLLGQLIAVSGADLLYNLPVDCVVVEISGDLLSVDLKLYMLDHIHRVSVVT